MIKTPEDLRGLKESLNSGLKNKYMIISPSEPKAVEKKEYESLYNKHVLEDDKWFATAILGMPDASAFNGLDFSYQAYVVSRAFLGGGSRVLQRSFITSWIMSNETVYMQKLNLKDPTFLKSLVSNSERSASTILMRPGGKVRSFTVPCLFDDALFATIKPPYVTSSNRSPLKTG